LWRPSGDLFATVASTFCGLRLPASGALLPEGAINSNPFAACLLALNLGQRLRQRIISLPTHRTLLRAQPERGDAQRHVADQPGYLWMLAHHHLINQHAKDYPAHFAANIARILSKDFLP
jgi:hypothetical protein